MNANQVYYLYMKKIKCLDCDKEFSAETEKEALDQMRPHYMESHKDIMKEGTEAKKKEWFERLHKDWESAKEV